MNYAADSVSISTRVQWIPLVSGRRGTYGHDRAHGANDEGPEDGGLLADGPAEVLGGGLEEFDGSHGW